MKTQQSVESVFSIGVPESAHTVTTTCPHCKTGHSVVLAASQVEADAMQKALDRVSEARGTNTSSSCCQILSVD